MTQMGQILEALTGQGGVMGAAFVSGEGEILASRAAGHDLADVSTILGSCLASNRLLTELVGAEVASQTVLSFASGTLLLTRAADTLTVVALTTDAEADRVRFSLRRLLPQLDTTTGLDTTKGEAPTEDA